MPRRESALPTEFWVRDGVAEALATCDLARVLAQVRHARGWSQGELARAVGYSQSWVSRVVNRQQSLTVDQVREIAGRLGIPVHLLRFADSAELERGAGPTRRREFGKAVAAAALAPRSAPQSAEADEGTAPTLRAITGGQRRLDAAAPSRELARGAVAHVELTGRTLARSRSTPFAPGIAAAASEAAGFAAWLHADMDDAGSARGYYRTAVRNARLAGDPLLGAYMTGSLAAFETDTEDAAAGLDLAGEAARLLGPDAHPTATAWLACTRAMAHATLGDAEAADAQIATAEHAVERSDNTGPPWPWVFPFTSAKVAGYRALTGVRLHRPHEARAAFVEAFGGVRPSPKQGAGLMVELASAHADAGDVDEAFSLAAESLRIGAHFRSDRLISRVRRFRRAYKGPGARCVKDLDAHLAAALAG
ncbi:helix-turn-helix transcriptional regulator [Streptomonospora wellingtoniae]|uniref:Helix-turn-helix transcriptional regulator n=1 Tax=Streptomonospora wellingtoniae TaxID=3075544 RepID=A0ABU2KTV1_9ACTN|nr:helix-turn-helix transcriptional regulator [Streptomonospora sp. DSM 45055]MDT0302719.1 helix-turn-helix transcriptional regulator [Streptomonospora sp. DSM 45055]